MSKHRWATRVVVASSCLLALSCEDLPDVPNLPPTATFVHSPISPIVAGQSVVTFNAAGSRDADGTIARYNWDFGDGTPQVTGDRVMVTHVYPDTPATCQETIYTALLTVVDDGGDSGVASAQVHVVELPAPGSRACQ